MPSAGDGRARWRPYVPLAFTLVVSGGFLVYSLGTFLFPTCTPTCVADAPKGCDLCPSGLSRLATLTLMAGSVFGAALVLTVWEHRRQGRVRVAREEDELDFQRYQEGEGRPRYDPYAP